MNTEELEDNVLLKELVDEVSILADQKDFRALVQLFTDDAVSETIANGTTILKLQGRKAMAEAFADFNKSFDTVYHFNGQQVITLSGNKATGTSYSLVTLIGSENSKKVKTTIGATYHDEYIREDNRWLIAGRVGTFNWQTKEVY